LVAGVARAGQAAALALAASRDGSAVRAWDVVDSPRTREARDALAPAGVEVALGGDGTGLLDGPARPRCLVKSPGIAPDAPLVRAATARGLPVLDELEVGWRLDRRPVVGITGTNGKSTVAELVRAILERAGARPAVAGNTVFGPPLSGLPHAAADIAVVEVSSFQLEACPAFLPDVAVVTNLTEDHLDRHGTMAAYGRAKRRIVLRAWARAPSAVVGVDEPFGRVLARDAARAGVRVLGVGWGRDASHRLDGWELAGAGSVVRARLHGERLELRTALIGEHNARNALVALAVADVLGVGRDVSVAALAGAPALPGRLEAVGAAPFEVLVDYAHNPDGIRQALRAARARCHVSGARVVAVACALRMLAPEQIRAMGHEAAVGCEHLLLCPDPVLPDEPAGELPPGLEEGARAAAGATVEVLPDRREAIRRAVASARPGDVVAILGRGVREHAVDGDGRSIALLDRDVACAALDCV
jgi:UDP-N-acetylmuramoylalanine-D-glutamate ligase